MNRGTIAAWTRHARQASGSSMRNSLPTLTRGLVFVCSIVAGHALAATTLAPANGGLQVCTDAPLSIKFDTLPRLGTTGTIKVFRTDGTLVDTINLADATTLRRTVGGAVSDTGLLHTWRYFPVIISGNTASIYLHNQLAYGTTYYVTIDPTVLTDSQGFAGIQDPEAWRFTTRTSPPAAGTSQLTVAGDGSGDFCTVQAAIDFVPVNNTQKVDINVKKGVYTELVYVAPAKPFITVRGEDRDQTIVQYTNNDTLNVLPFTNTSDPNNQCINRRIPGTPDLWNCWRASFGVEANDFTLENITLHNTTPTGGSQAEAFRGNADRTTLNLNADQSANFTLRPQYVTSGRAELATTHAGVPSVTIRGDGIAGAASNSAGVFKIMAMTGSADPRLLTFSAPGMFTPCPTLRNSTSAMLRIGFGMTGSFDADRSEGTGLRRFPKTTLIPARRSSSPVEFPPRNRGGMAAPVQIKRARARGRAIRRAGLRPARCRRRASAQCRARWRGRGRCRPRPGCARRRAAGTA